MQKYFDLLLELLRPEDDEFVVEEKKKLSAAAKKIEERGEKGLRITHKVGFIFQAYDDLLNERISLDEFLTTGDITSENKLNISDKSSLDLVNSMIDGDLKDENTLFILDSISFGSLTNDDKKIIQSRAKNYNSELIFC